MQGTLVRDVRAVRASAGTRLNDHASNLDEGLAVVVRGVKEHLAADVCSVCLVDAAGSNFVLMATDGLDPRAAGEIRFGRREGLVGLVVERRRPVSLTNAQQHARFRHFPEFGEQAYRAFLGAPIMHYRKVPGVLAVRQINDRAFDGEQEAFPMTIAAELAGSWAPGALRRTVTEHAQTFEQMDDPYLGARAEDVRGLGRRVLLHLQSGKPERKEYAEQCVLVGEASRRLQRGASESVLRGGGR